MTVLFMMIYHKTVRKRYDKMIQSFNFPFPEHVVFDSERSEYFLLLVKNSNYLTKTCKSLRLGKICYVSLRSINFLCKRNLVIQK